MGCTQKACHNKFAKKSKGKSAVFPILTGLLIAILPKCPFCIMAYSGAVSLCSGKMLFPNANTYSGYIIVGLSILVLLGILLNFKGKRTWIAAGITFFGMLLLTISQFYSISESLYYIAVAFLFFGIWYNGSFHYFYRNFFQHFFNKINSKKTLHS